MHFKAFVNFFLLAVISFLFEQSDGKQYFRDINFKTHEDSAGRKVCSIDNSSQIVDKVRWKIECTLLCQETAGCFGVNWKEPNTCEIYNSVPKTFVREARCTFIYPYVNECLDSPCLNGAACTDLIFGFNCNCSAGFTGSTCATNINECQSKPCLNGACNDLVNGYKCTCQPGYTGIICETNTWILVLRNDIAGSDSYFFNRSWAEYENEFGNKDPYNSKYWIGLNTLQNKSQAGCTFRVELQRPDGTWRTASYASSSIGDSSSNYKLTLGPYSGDLWDAITYHNGQQFSTYDADNDASPGNCAQDFGGGFWFKNCGIARITASPTTNFTWTSFYYNSLVLQLQMVQAFLLC